MTDVRTTTYELWTLLMPEAHPSDATKEEWRSSAERCFHVMLGMYLGSSITREAVMEAIKSVKSSPTPEREQE